MRGMACRSAQHRVCSMQPHLSGTPPATCRRVVHRRVVHRRVVHRPVAHRRAADRRAADRRVAGRRAATRAAVVAFGPRAVGLREGGELRAREVRAGHSSPRRESAGRGSVPPPSGPSTAQARPGPPLPQAARDLLIDASRGLGRAIRATNPADRYAAAHLAALRAAAAVLAARARPVRGRRGSAWELITKVAPEFAEWAAFFAAGSAKRQAAEAGLHRLVTAREADDMLRQVSAFIDLVEESLSPDERRAASARPDPAGLVRRAAVSRAAVRQGRGQAR